MPQDPGDINYTTGQPIAVPNAQPGSQYVAPAPESSGKDESVFESERNKEYMEKRARANVKRFTPRPPALSYSLAHEARKKK